MWKSKIVLLCVVVTCSAATTDRYIDDILNHINDELNANWSKEVNIDQECEIPDSSTEVGHCVKKSLCAVAIPTEDPIANFTPRSIRSTGYRKKRASDDSKGKCQRFEVCCPVNSIISRTAKPPQPVLGCGYGNPGALRDNDRATFALYADFPWMVALMVKSNKREATFKDEYIGGGTIIHPSVVMTVGHKVAKIRDPTSLKCRAGEWDSETSNEQYVHQDREVASVIVHENFNSVHFHYDIALLKLKSAFNLKNAPHIGVACLEKTLPSAGTVCYSMGWGKDAANKMDNAKVLKKLTMPLVAGDDCEQKLRPKLTARYNLHNTLTCAGGEAGVDTCVGDGGAPLVCSIPDKNRQRYSVVGMVAYGLGCGNADEPGVYAKVPELYGWVEKQMKMTLKIEPTSFVY